MIKLIREEQDLKDFDIKFPYRLDGKQEEVTKKYKD